MTYTPGLNPEETIDLGGGESIFPIGNIIIKYSHTYPITSSNLNSREKPRYSNYEIDYYDSTYHQFYNEIIYSQTNGTSSRSEIDLKFNTLDDLITHINNNVNNNGSNTTENVIVRIYGKIKYPGFQKIYGMNKLYSMLRGRKMYKKSLTYIGEGGVTVRWSNLDNFVIDIWNTALGGSIIDITRIADAKRGTWFPRNYRNMYKLLRLNQLLSFPHPNTRNRAFWDWGSSDFTNLGSSSDGWRIVKVFYGGIDNSLNYSIHDSEILSQQFLRSKVSIVQIYKLENVYDSNKISLMIKPVGMDIWRFGYINDPLSYELFGVSYDGSKDNQPKIMSLGLGGGNTLIDASNDVSYTISLEDLNQLIYNSGNYGHLGSGSLGKSIRFFYSDGNGNISELSSEVVPIFSANVTKKLTINSF